MEPHSDSPQHGANGRASFNWFFVALFFIFVIYPLSIGPTGLLQTKFPALDFFRWYIDSWLNIIP